MAPSRAVSALWSWCRTTPQTAIRPTSSLRLLHQILQRSPITKPITTNLKLAELKNPPDLAHARIYDRILERCAPILFAGKNFREENAGATRQAAKDIVNRKSE